MPEYTLSGVVPDNLQILIADDDIVDREAARRALQALGVAVKITEAENAASVCRLLEQSALDCAFMDFQFPDGNGLEVLGQIRSAGIKTPVIMLTGHGDEFVAVELMKAGASDYLAKSRLTPETLGQSLRHVLQVRQAEDQAARAAHSLQFLSDASNTIALSLDYEATLTSIAQLAAGRIADICVIDMLEPDGHLRRMAAVHADPAKAHLVEKVHHQYPPIPGGAHPVLQVLQTGKSVLMEKVPDNLQETIAYDKEHKRLLQELNYQSYIVVPMQTRGRTIGAISLLSTSADHLYDNLDLILAEELARRSAVAADNARLYREAQEALHSKNNALEELKESNDRYRFLAEAIPQIVWSADETGGNSYYNQRWYAYTGLKDGEFLADSLASVIHPDDLPGVMHAWNEVIKTGDLFECEYRLRRRDGAYRWHLGRAVSQHDDAGRIVKWFGTATDIDDRKRSEENQRFLAEAGKILGSSLDYLTTLAGVARLAVPHIADWTAVHLIDETGNIRQVETAHIDPAKIALAREMERRYPVDMSAPNGLAEVVRSGRSEMVSDIPDELLAANAQDEEHLRILREVGLKSYICVPLIARARILGAITLIAAESGRRYQESDLAIAEELARRAALAVDNARLFHETRTRANREAVVNAINKTLRGSLDTDEIIRTATTEVGRALGASRCTWSWVDAKLNSIEISEEQYLRPGVEPIRGNYPFSLFPAEVIARWSRGEMVIVSDFLHDPMIETYRDKIGRAPTTSAFIACPIFLRGVWTGVLTVHHTSGAHAWSKDEITLINAVVDMLTLALENARVYAHEHRVAEMLQGAFLTNIPDHLPGLSIATDYRAGLEESHVGGDFYDAFLLPDGRIGIVMADVSGKGLSAAVQTATVKYSLRAFAAEAAAPSLVLSRLNRAVRNETSGLGEHFVTLFYGVFDPVTGRLSYASAGHETQVIKRASGGITRLEANGPILGVTEHRYEQTVERLEIGDVLILFTDGLTEARSAENRELLEIDRVAASVAGAHPQAGAGALVARLGHLAMDWTGGHPQDDLALLAARRQTLAAESDDYPPPSSFGFIRERAAADQKGDLLFAFSFPSRSDYAAEVRQAVAHWMGTLGYDRSAIEDFQTAVTEAVTNAVRHGSPQGPENQFQVSGSLTADGALAVDVTDEGLGLSTLDDNPAMPEPEAMGGRGLPLMQVLSDSVIYFRMASGHCVRLIKKNAEADLE